jgi:hypothetical protein
MKTVPVSFELDVELESVVIVFRSAAGFWRVLTLPYKYLAPVLRSTCTSTCCTPAPPRRYFENNCPVDKAERRSENILVLVVYRNVCGVDIIVRAVIKIRTVVD